jgi:NAD(P)-dependent dehydrogenase (short-subunit alcohol dehydrogenase family)
MNKTQGPRILIAGASSSIAQALIQRLTTNGLSGIRSSTQLADDLPVISLSGARCRMSAEPLNAKLPLEQQETPGVCLQIDADLTQPDSVPTLQAYWQSTGAPDWVFHCSGILHQAKQPPEKSIRDINADWVQASVTANLITHLHLAQSIAPFVSRKKSVRWISLSAKVGSIGDNQLGGWYSYRMTKAALNMMVRNLDIEWRRKNPACRIAAVHPGTTDTPLSQPFQAGIQPGKLYSPQQTAERMLNIMANLSEAQSGKLLFWDGTELPW